MDDNQLSQRAAIVDAEGRQRFGDTNWTSMCEAMGQQGINQQVLTNIVVRGDAVSILRDVAHRAVDVEMERFKPSSNEFRRLDQAHQAIRADQQTEHARLRGRR
jgi:hypothetical protein